ncbi:MAG: DUF2318 domain-containing protein [Syntrophus sp. (in: bacteria)]|nr:DUF2318 domain-containing protein [Syntrophus sp. (in: bacteria)]
MILVMLAILVLEAAAAAGKTDKTQSSGDVSYPISIFDDGKAHHFAYKTSDGVDVRYFVIKSSDGVIRAAFDTCVVCWREGKGYFQKDDTMVCKNCGKRFKSTKINDVTGGCNPAPLSRKVENGKVVIKAESFLEGKQLFAFSGGR